MHVKICGLTRLDDARAALDAGADLLGFNFYPPSPRYVEPKAAAGIVAALRAEYAGRAFVSVGVFVNETPERVRSIMAQAGLDRAQLHGNETPAAVRAAGDLAYKALRPASLAELDRIPVVTIIGSRAFQGFQLHCQNIGRFGRHDAKPKPLGRWVKPNQDAVDVFLARAGVHDYAFVQPRRGKTKPLRGFADRLA